MPLDNTDKQCWQIIHNIVAKPFTVVKDTNRSLIDAEHI
jgi:hypothetical protein